MTIDRLEPEKAVALTLVFAGEGSAAATIALEPAGAGTKVVWAFDSDLGFDPIARYFGLLIDGMVGPDYEKGLAKLKAVAEAKPAAG
jgi:carbon monoxide dehydrogenase subunit G